MMIHFWRRLLIFPLRHKTRSASRGAILFLAVGILAVLSILAIGATSSVLQELKLAKFLTDNNTSWYAPISVVSSMNVAWAHDPTPALITAYDLRPREIPFGDKIAQVTLVDEQSRINIAKASKNILLRLPALAGDENLLKALQAAPPVVKEELLLLEGMNQGIYNQIKDLITVYGSGTVNINTATEQTFFALGLDNDLVTKIRMFRAGPDGQEGTPDDRVFFSTPQIIPSLEPYRLSLAQHTVLEELIASGQFGVTTDCVTFDIALKKNDKTIRSFKITENLGNQRIVSWQEM